MSYGTKLIQLSFNDRVLALGRYFKDVDRNKWYYNAVKYVFDKDIMSGYDDNTFRPSDSITRAEVAQIIYNMRNK